MILALIQARYNSTRLPGKILKKIAGKPLLEHVIDRLKESVLIHTIAVATTTNEADDRTEELCNSLKIPCFRGSENDVLDRYYQASVVFHEDVVIRITGDCPLIDAQIVDETIARYFHGGYDYVNNFVDRRYPDGLDTEVFSIQALTKAWKEAKLQSEREHVTPYIWKNPSLFRIGSIRNTVDLSHLRWTVDEPKDLIFIRRLYRYFNGKEPHMMAILGILEEHPELNQINQGIATNEGYIKSLKEDKEIK